MIPKRIHLRRQLRRIAVGTGPAKKAAVKTDRGLHKLAADG